MVDGGEDAIDEETERRKAEEIANKKTKYYESMQRQIE